MSEWEPRVWVGCMACYNDGRLIGAWYDPAETDLSELSSMHVHEQYVTETHTDAVDWRNHEELWVYDSEGFEGFHDGEGQPADFQATYGAVEHALDETGADVEALRAFVAYDSSVMEGDLVESFQDSYCGQFYDLTAYAEDAVDEGLFGDIPDAIASYVDYDKIARDLHCEGYWVSDEGGYVFRPY